MLRAWSSFSAAVLRSPSLEFRLFMPCLASDIHEVTSDEFSSIDFSNAFSMSYSSSKYLSSWLKINQSFQRTGSGNLHENYQRNSVFSEESRPILCWFYAQRMVTPHNEKIPMSQHCVESNVIGLQNFLLILL